MGLTSGTRLGPYEIVCPLGEGGMGEVYRAHDTRLDRDVAIKILPAQFSSDTVRKQRFEREAKAISSLNHPHICMLYDVGHQDGTDFLVMECVEGETLAKRLERDESGSCALFGRGRCGFLRRPSIQFPGKVVEDAQLITVQIGDPELAQVPWFVLRLSEDLRPGIAPAMVELVDFLLAIQIQPDHDRAARTVVLVERRIRQEDTALPLRDASDAALIVTPVEMEAEHIHVILGGLLDIADRNLWNRLWKVREHVLHLTLPGSPN
jgi:hypothetical protein